MSKTDNPENKTRKIIFNYILAHPGVSFNTIKKMLDLTDSTLRYHLRYLQRANKILPKTEGGHRCYYPTKGIESDIDPIINFDLNRLTKIQRRILDAIRDNPGITLSELIYKTNLKRKTLKYNIRKLRDIGIIWKVSKGRNTGYEHITKEKLRSEIIKVLINKFLNDEIDKDTLLILKKELMKEYDK